MPATRVALSCAQCTHGSPDLRHAWRKCSDCPWAGPANCGARSGSPQASSGPRHNHDIMTIRAAQGKASSCTTLSAFALSHQGSISSELPAGSGCQRWRRLGRSRVPQSQVLVVSLQQLASLHPKPGPCRLARVYRSSSKNNTQDARICTLSYDSSSLPRAFQLLQTLSSTLP